MTPTQILEVVASFSLQVLIVLAVGKLLEGKVRRSVDRCAVWTACFYSVLLLGCAALFLPRLHLVQPWASLGASELLAVASAQNLIGRAVIAIWSVGASFLLIRWIARSYLLRRSMCGCEQLPKEEVQRLMDVADVPFPEEQLPVVLISDQIDGPYCRQLHRPTIVLPRFLLAGDKADLRNVLLHEIEHLRTNHPLQLFLQQVVQVLCWFHPMVWSAGWQASLTREFACDDAAAENGANSAAYLRTLLHIAERCESAGHSSVIRFGRTRPEIVIRAQRLVKLAKEPGSGRTYRRFGRRAATALLLFTTCLLSQVWLPIDALASSRSTYSPWPSWTAAFFHSFGCNLRDYESFDSRVQMYELRRRGMRATDSSASTARSHSTAE